MKIIAIIANFIFIGLLAYNIYYYIELGFSFSDLLILIPILTNLLLFIKKEKYKNGLDTIAMFETIAIMANISLLIFMILLWLEMNYNSNPFQRTRASGLIFLSFFILVFLFNTIVLYFDLKKLSKIDQCNTHTS